jgi:peroxiredoxin (alkyl hydroperoxide reductase subunit C)
MVLVGKKAPDFTAPAVLANNTIADKFNFRRHCEGKYAVLFFYPLDFTFVCPSEILAFDKRYKEFAMRNTEVVAVSVDSHFTHMAWKNTPVNQGGLGMVKFPMVADLTKSIAMNYGILHDNAVALRGTFLVDREGIVRHQVVNDLPLGRNVDEAIRMVDALQFHEAHGEVCPAGWTPGQEGMKATAKGVAEYLAANSSKL